jgi:hypothetical protein
MDGHRQEGVNGVKWRELMDGDRRLATTATTSNWRRVNAEEDVSLLDVLLRIMLRRNGNDHACDSKKSTTKGVERRDNARGGARDNARGGKFSRCEWAPLWWP